MGHRVAQRLGFFVLLIAGLGLVGCTTLNSVPTASFTCSSTSGPAPLVVTFDATGSSDVDGSIVSYSWAFGDGGTGSGISISHTYTASGYYSAQLTVRDDAGATATASRGVSVTAGSKLTIQDWSLQAYDNMFMPWVIVGHAKNTSGRALSYAEVDGQFYDAGGVLLASWIDNISNLAAGVVWEFRIYCMDSAVADRVDHAAVTVGSCY